ncbi:LuxR C-terminal-related transcriptional regulator [Kitasatospora sp. NPDC051170]|uniref:LuxR C-terminal-related transcriptional regulator n=1 Tax=Kitasatospora sp. NPDC051170 TaxID=3364056 RepID=UPI0037B183AF
MTDGPGPAESALYLAAVRRGGRLRPEDLAPEDRPTLAALVARGLLAPTTSGWTAASPRALGDRLGGELRTRATRLLQRAEHLPDGLAPLALAYDSAQPPGPGNAAPAVRSVHLDGDDAVRGRIAGLIADCREEFLSAQPGPRPVEAMRSHLPRDLALLRRGCTMRTLYQPVAATERPVLEQISLRTGAGAQIRVLAEPYARMMLFDRSTAVIPAGEGSNSAVVLTDPATISFLITRFERDWTRATPAEGHLGPPHPTTVRVGRLLARGLTQRVVAVRLGLSERTVAAHISRLRERYGAQTLFHLGWQMRGAGDA